MRPPWIVCKRVTSKSRAHGDECDAARRFAVRKE
jgi:hypothetical protein